MNAQCARSWQSFTHIQKDKMITWKINDSPEFRLIWLVSELLRLWAELCKEFKLFESLSINLLAASNFARSCSSAVGIDSFSIFRTLLLSDSDVESVMLYKVCFLLSVRFSIFFMELWRLFIIGKFFCSILLSLCDVTTPGSFSLCFFLWWMMTIINKVLLCNVIFYIW